MEEFNKKHKNKIIIPIRVSLAVLVLAIVITIRVKATDFTGWLGFLGSFLGAIIGGVITISGVAITLQDSDDNRKKDKIDEIRPFLVL